MRKVKRPLKNSGKINKARKYGTTIMSYIEALKQNF